MWALSQAGLKSEVEISVTYDPTPPRPRSTPALMSVHTGGPSPKYQSVGCCISVSWEPALEDESDVQDYKLCFAQQDGDELRTASGFDVDQARHPCTLMHSICAHHRCTLPMHTSYACTSPIHIHAHHLCTPPMHTLHTTYAHHCRVHHPCTPPMHTTHAHHLCTPPIHTTYAHHPCTPPPPAVC